MNMKNELIFLIDYAARKSMQKVFFFYLEVYNKRPESQFNSTQTDLTVNSLSNSIQDKDVGLWHFLD